MSAERHRRVRDPAASSVTARRAGTPWSTAGFPSRMRPRPFSRSRRCSRWPTSWQSVTTSFWSRECSLEAGLPDPELGSALYDAAGRWIGFFDLTWRAARLIAEYDGDQHRTSTKQYELDIRRFDDAAGAGYRVIRVRAHGLVRTDLIPPAEVDLRPVDAIRLCYNY